MPVPVSDVCLELVARLEGFRPTWYRDSAAVWTIGHGFTEQVDEVDRSLIDRLGRVESRRILARQLGCVYGPDVRSAVETELDDHQWSALYSFAYNVGASAMRESTLVELLNDGHEERAEQEFTEWVYAGGRVVDGLVRRRQAERALFELDEGPDNDLILDVVEHGGRRGPGIESAGGPADANPVPVAGVARKPVEVEVPESLPEPPPSL